MLKLRDWAGLAVLVIGLQMAAAWAGPTQVLHSALPHAVEINGRSFVYDSGAIVRFSSPTNMTDCAANGSTTVSVPKGQYIMLITTEAATVCDGATCSSGGTTWVVGTQLPVFYDVATTVSCKSTGATGDVQFVPNLVKL